MIHPRRSRDRCDGGEQHHHCEDRACDGRHIRQALEQTSLVFAVLPLLLLLLAGKVLLLLAGLCALVEKIREDAVGRCECAFGSRIR